MVVIAFLALDIQIKVTILTLMDITTENKMKH